MTTIVPLLAVLIVGGMASSTAGSIRRLARRRPAARWSRRWDAARDKVFGPTCRNARCQSRNRPVARFCCQCGTAIGVDPADRRPAPNWQWGRGSRGGLW